MNYENGRHEGWYKYPIKDQKEIEKLLRIPGKVGLMVKFGLFWGLRVNEIVSLKWSDVIERGKPIEQFRYRVGKQSKLQNRQVTRLLKMGPDLQEAVYDFYNYCGRPSPDRYVFYPNVRVRLNRHVTTKTAREWLKAAASKIGLRDPDIDFHTLRRSMIWRYWKKNGTARTLAMTGHSSLVQLLTYIGETDEMVSNGFDGLYEEEVYEDLMAMFENGRVDLDVAQLVATVPPQLWRKEVQARLRQYTTDEEQIVDVCRALLLPYWAKRVGA